MKTALHILFIGLLFGCTQSRTDSAESLVLIECPAGSNSSLPNLTRDRSGKLLMSWVEKVGDAAELKFATFMQESWSVPALIASGKDWFVNWADYPSVTSSGEQMLAHFLAKSGEGTYAYDVHLTQSGNHGQDWNEDYIPHDDGTQTEHGFVTLLPYKDGFFAAWLDGRNTTGHDHEGGQGAMTIRGAFISKDGEKSGEALLDDKVCDCCQTGGAITENGPIVVYRDRSDDEIRDMSIVRYVDGGWTTPETIHKDDWKIPGCPVNGPSAAAWGSNLAVAWFSAANQESQVKVILSDNNGETFGRVIMIDNTNPIGRVDVAMFGEDRVAISWLDKSQSGAEIKFALVSSNGEIMVSSTVAQTDPSRKSGFPQMEVVDNDIYFAWTEVKGEQTQIRTARWQGGP